MNAHSAEKDAATWVRCPGTGTPAMNVGRGWVGNRLQVVGDCQTCGRRPEITEAWAVKYHRTRVAPTGGTDA